MEWWDKIVVQNEAASSLCQLGLLIWTKQSYLNGYFLNSHKDVNIALVKREVNLLHKMVGYSRIGGFNYLVKPVEKISLS